MTTVTEASIREGELTRFVAASGRWPALAEVLAEEGAAPPLDRLRELIAEGRIAAEAFAEAAASFYRLPRIGLDAMEAMTDLCGDVSLRFLRANAAVPLEDSRGITVAVVDPSVPDIAGAMALALGRPVRLAVATLDAVEALLARASEVRDLSEAAAEAGEGDADGSADDIRDLAEGAPVVRALDAILEQAVALRATDIHIEPAHHGLAVRLRIDGILRPTTAPPAAMARALVSRVKILAGLDIAERRLPQDGRIRIKVGRIPLDIRVATMPTIHGEAAVLRILARETSVIQLERLGLAGRDEERLLRQAAAPFGMIVVTGPTGSGKTTTLAALLQHLADGVKKIVTIEDPVEYQVPGVMQTQVQPAIGLSFGRALRAFLRQDPDVIMVGEIRDSETAEIAVHAALTGHLVLTTLHTNTAAGAIARLLDMGVESFLLAASLRCVVGQRLIRRLCERCSRPAPVTGAVLRDNPVFAALGVSEGEMLHEPVGCSACGQIGYRGRSGVFEVLTLDHPVRRLVVPGADVVEIEKAARASGMTTMLEDGIRRCRTGETALDEVVRVAASL